MRRAARWLLRRAARRSPWTGAVLAELDQVTGAWATLRWTAGGLRVAWQTLPRRVRLTRLAVALAAVAAASGPVAFDVRYIPSTSMEPTLRATDRVLVDRLAFRLTGITYGDVVVLRIDRPTGERSSTVDRVVGLGGDRIECTAGRVWRNGSAVDEPYVHGAPTDCTPVTVPPGSAYVLGDNRATARDSRHYGPLPTSAVAGVVLTG